MTLANLPTELIQDVSIHLDLISLCSLRLTCSSLNEQTLHVFKTRFFHQHTLRWDLSSFQTLLSITQNQIFGRQLHTLVINATPTYAMQLWEIDKRISDSATTVATLHGAAERSTRYWNETQLDARLLTQIFGIKKELKSIVFKYDGMDKQLGKFARKYCEASQNEMSRPFVVTLSAIATSNLNIHSITTDPDFNHGAVSIGRMESLSRHLRQLNTALSNLHTLQLHLRDWRHYEEGFELSDDRPSFVVRFLSKCQNLSSLTLSCYSSLEGNVIPTALAQHCRFPFLQSCSLELLRYSYVSDLFDFLAPSSKTLRTLKLKQIVNIDDHVGWDEVLRGLSDRLELTSVDMRALFNRRGARVGTLERWGVGPIVLKGTSEEVREGLRDAAEGLVSSSSGPAWHLAAVAYPFVGMRT